MEEGCVVMRFSFRKAAPEPIKTIVMLPVLKLKVGMKINREGGSLEVLDIAPELRGWVIINTGEGAMWLPSAGYVEVLSGAPKWL